MADPQVRNGYTRIDNELLEAICRLNISGNEMRILLYIIRRTYGFNRTYAEMPLSEISAAVGVRREHIQKALKRLSNQNIIELRTNPGVKPQTISVVKNYEKWAVESCASLLLQKIATVAENGNTTVAENCNTTVAENCNTTVAENCNSTYKENKESIKERGKKNPTPKKENIKTKYGNYENVLLSADEYSQLVSDYGESNIREYIRRVDEYVQSSGKRYSDYAVTIRRWLEKDNVKKDNFDMEKYRFVINNI